MKPSVTRVRSVTIEQPPHDQRCPDITAAFDDAIRHFDNPDPFDEVPFRADEFKLLTVELDRRTAKFKIVIQAIDIDDNNTTEEK